MKKQVPICALFLLSILSLESFCDNKDKNEKSATNNLGNAIKLNGLNSYIEVPNHDSLNFLTTFTIEFWIKPCRVTGNNVIISKQKCPNEFSFYISIKDGKLNYTAMPLGATTCNTPLINFTGSSNIFVNQWTHVALVHTPEEIKVYIDGFPETGTFTGPLLPNGTIPKVDFSTTPLRIGAYENSDGSFGSFYYGLIDEVRFWKDTRTAQEIFSNFTSSLSGNEQDLVGYYDMEQTGSGPGLRVIEKVGMIIFNHRIYHSAIAGTTKVYNSTQTAYPAFVNGTTSACITGPITRLSNDNNNNLPVNETEYNSSQVSINPNPVTSVSEFRFTQMDGAHTLTVFNIAGEELMKLEFADGEKVTVPKENLIEGFYFFNIKNLKSNKVYNGKFMVK